MTSLQTTVDSFQRLSSPAPVAFVVSRWDVVMRAEVGARNRGRRFGNRL